MIKQLTRLLSGPRRSIRVRAFLLNSALATVIVVTLVLLIFGWFQQKSLQDINAMTKVLLWNMDYRASDLFSGTGGLAYQLYQNNNCTELMLAKERNISNEVRVSTAIEDLMISNPYMQSVYILNGDRVLMRKDRGSWYDAETDGEILALVHENRILTPIPRQIQVGKNATLNVISIIYHNAYPNNELMNGAVIININAESWFRYISATMADAQGSIFVVDDSGHVLGHQDRTQYLADLSASPDIRDILAQTDATSGSLYTVLDGERTAVSWVQSEDGRRLSITRIPYRTMTESLSQAKNFILLLCIVFLIILMVSFFLLTQKLLKPVTQIVHDIQTNTRKLGLTEGDTAGGDARDELGYISKSMSGVLDYIGILDKREKDNTFILRNSLVRTLLDGSGDLPPASELAVRFARARIGFDPTRPHLIIVLRLDEHQNSPDRDSADGDKARDLLLFSIGNIACELLGEGFSGYAFESSGDHEILLVNVDPVRIPEAAALLAERLDEVIDKVRLLLNASITAAFTRPSEDAAQLRRLYRRALDATDARLLQGDGRVYAEDSIPAPNTLFDARTGEAELTQVVAAAKDSNREAFDQTLAGLMTKAVNLPHEASVKLFSRLHAELMAVLGHLNPGEEGADDDLITAYREIYRMSSPHQLREWFAGVFDRICGQLSSANGMAAKTLIDEALRYLQEHYADSQISGNSMARRLSISPQYFSKVFSERTGSAFPEYLNRIRLEKARTLLLESDLNALEIGEKVGYANRSYFSTLFKKAYGVSPVKYRMMHAKP